MPSSSRTIRTPGRPPPTCVRSTTSSSAPSLSAANSGNRDGGSGERELRRKNSLPASRYPPPRLPLLPRALPNDGLSLDLRVCPRGGLQLTAREHRCLIAEEGRLRFRAFAVGEHGERLGLVAELHREDPSVAAHRLSLAIRVVAILEN